MSVSKEMLELAERCEHVASHSTCEDPRGLLRAVAAALRASAVAEPVAYAVYGIGGGKVYLHAVKPIVDDEWKCDDCGLGDYWSGNRPLASLPAPEAAPTREEVAAVLAQELWCGATFADAAPSEREAFLRAADAIRALKSAPAK